MKTRGTFKPEAYCPICGKRLQAEHMDGHHCAPSTLQAIDSANRRLERDDVPPVYETHTMRERLKDGFRWFRGR